MKKRTKICLVILLLIISAIGIWFYNGLKRSEESYAAWNTTKAIAAYIIRNEGRLPAKWDDLVVIGDPYFEAESINGYKEKVIVKFKGNSVDIQTVSGRKPLYNKPNEEIQQLLRESDLPMDERKLFYWAEYSPRFKTN